VTHPRHARSVPGSIFEGDKEADKAGVYRRSHAAKYYDETEDKLVARAAAPEFAAAPASAGAASADFTIKVVNGVPQVVAKGPSGSAELEAAALKSNSLLVAPLKVRMRRSPFSSVRLTLSPRPRSRGRLLRAPRPPRRSCCPRERSRLDAAKQRARTERSSI
jgi:hypothetical protein